MVVQKYTHLPPPCRPMAVSSKNDNGSVLGVFTHLGNTWQEEVVNVLDRKTKQNFFEKELNIEMW